MPTDVAALSGILMYVLFLGIICVVEIISLWGLSKLLKFKKQDIKTPIIVSVASTIIAEALSFFLYSGLMGNYYYPEGLILFIALQLVLFVIYLFLIKRFYDENWKKTLMMGVPTIIVTMAAYILLTIVFAVIGIALENYSAGHV